jgi:hypothetical protein
MDREGISLGGNGRVGLSGEDRVLSAEDKGENAGRAWLYGSTVVSNTRSTIFLLGVVRYITLGITVYHFIPLFSLCLPASLGLLLVLLCAWCDDGRATGNASSLQVALAVSLAYDLATLVGMCTVGIQVVFALLSEPSGGINDYLAWVYWVALLYACVTSISLCCQAYVLRTICLGRLCCCGRGKPMKARKPPTDAGQYYTVAESVESSDVSEYGNDDVYGLGGTDDGLEDLMDINRANKSYDSNGGFTDVAQRRRLFPMILLGIVTLVVVILNIWGIHDTMLMFAMEPTPTKAAQTPSGVGCDPFVNEACALPFPSDMYLEEDSTTHSQKRVQFSLEAFPETKFGKVSPWAWNLQDGFSTTAPALFSFAENVTTSNLIRWEAMGAYAFPNATTVLLNNRTGEKVAHFVDRDSFDLNYGHPKEEPDLLILQPGHVLEFNTTYIVAVRHLISENSGDRVKASPAFAALRDGKVPPRELQEVYGVSNERADRYDRYVFPALAAAGFARSELQLAFYFSTTSREESLGRFEHIRDATMKKYPHGPKDFAITSAVTHECAAPGTNVSANGEGTATSPIAVELNGHFLTDNYLSHPGPGPQSYFHTTAEGPSTGYGIKPMPEVNGQAKVNFMLQIPCSIYTKKAPAKRVLQYGHGLFGSRAESRGHYLQALADRFEWIIVATDWVGMSKYDVLGALRVFMSRLGEFPAIPERTMQGFLDNTVMLQLLRGHLSKDPHLRIPGTMAPFIDKGTEFSYYGNSQGSVIGGGYFSGSTLLKRATLGVPGCPFALILSRSKDFSPYHAAFKFQVKSQRDLRIYISLVQQLWDPAESGGWLHVVRDNNWTGYPKKQVLLQAAIGDAQVAIVGGEFMARSYRANTVTPQTKPVYGVPERAPPFDGNGFVEWLYEDVPPTPSTDVPPAHGDTHECPRRERRAQEQMFNFFTSKQVMQPCHPGVCESKTCPTGNSHN